MKIITAKNCGFCFGVRKAVDMAYSYIDAGEKTYTYGELIHNELVVKNLNDNNITSVENIEEIDNCNLIIRSHGAPKLIYEMAKNKNINVIDATCPFVKKIHKIVQKYYELGYQVVIFGGANHPEVIGINGWCNNTAIIIDDEMQLKNVFLCEKICIVAQTTFSIEKFAKFIEIIKKEYNKIVEIFDTICYTTYKRQIEAVDMAKICDIVLVLGSKQSSNTSKLFELCCKYTERTYHIENTASLKNIKFFACDTIGIVAGASTPPELIMEVKGYMKQQFSEAQNEEFIKAIEDEKHVFYKPGKHVRCTVISADEKGVHIVLGGKLDGLIRADEMSLDGSYNPSDYNPGDELDATIINKKDEESNCVLLSKKQIDKVKEGDKFIETIRDGSEFELVIEKEIKGGLLSKIGTYSVFIPASQVRENFIKDLKPFVGKKLRLTVLEINDKDHKIVASQRKLLEKERLEKEETFWTHVQPNVVVSGKVKRVTNFGAFVSVDGFDCLAHIVDLSWNRIKNVEEVLKINESYDFLVLNVDKEKGRVSLGYKQLQPHPFVSAMEKYPIGSVHKGKVVRLVPFGAFIELEQGIDGLVHVSEAAHSYVKNISDVLKVGEEVDVQVMNVDEASRKITLSIKACIPNENPEPKESHDSENKNNTSAKPRQSSSRPRVKSEQSSNEQAQWSEDMANNPFADLLKDLDL